MKHHYITSGTCSRAIDFEINEGKLHDVHFTGGCNGNLNGLSRLVEGADALYIADKLEGTLCVNKCTSCPDQLSKAIRQALDK